MWRSLEDYSYLATQQGEENDAVRPDQRVVRLQQLGKRETLASGNRLERGSTEHRHAQRNRQYFTTLIHLVSAAWIWRTRWEGGMPTRFLPVEDFSTLESIRTRSQEEEGHMQRFLTTLQDEDLTREVRYIRPAAPGQVFNLPLWKSMLQVKDLRQRGTRFFVDTQNDT